MKIFPIARAAVVFAWFTCSTASVAFNAAERESPADLYTKGNLLYQQGRYKEAEEAFTKALTLVEQDRAPGAPRATGEFAKTPAPTGKTGPGKADTVVRTESAKKARPPLIPESAWLFADNSDPASKYPDVETPITLSENRGTPEYIVGPDDALGVFVWQNPDISGDVTVRTDGRISVPLAGDLVVSGKTIPQVGELISERLKKYVRFPEVAISLKKMGGKKIIILGEVAGPGVYTLTTGRTLIEALALAGGTTTEGLASTIIIIKGIFTGNPRVLRVSLNIALRGDMRQNVILEAEDVIFVPKKQISDLNYFLEQVQSIVSKGSVLSYAVDNFDYGKGGVLKSLRKPTTSVTTTTTSN